MNDITPSLPAATPREVPPAVMEQAVHARRVAANADAPPAVAAANNPWEPMMRHFWLLVRVLIFGYFFLGSNMGWRRPLVLGLLGLGFWLMHTGLFGEGGLIRGWWDGLVREGAAAVEPTRNAGEMPTPEDLARRLIEERRRGESEWIRWGRERIRAVVLMLASLWPGVGEAIVRAREAEARRRAEEEVAAGRRREEEAERNEAEKREAEKNEAEKKEVGKSEAERTEKTDAEAETAASALGGHSAT